MCARCIEHKDIVQDCMAPLIRYRLDVVAMVLIQYSPIDHSSVLYFERSKVGHANLAGKSVEEEKEVSRQCQLTTL